MKRLRYRALQEVNLNPADDAGSFFADDINAAISAKPLQRNKHGA